MAPSLDEIFAMADWLAVQRAAGWKATRDPEDPDRVVLDISARDGEHYRVLFLCDEYPRRSPSVAFVNNEGSKMDPRAWPRGDQEFLKEVKPPPNSFLCMPLTREGLAHHAEWARTAVGAWNPEVHTIMDLFNRVRRLLHGDHYLGRGGA